MKNFYFLLISSLFLTSGLYAWEKQIILKDFPSGLILRILCRDMLPGMAEDRICGKVKINR